MANQYFPSSKVVIKSTYKRRKALLSGLFAGIAAWRLTISGADLEGRNQELDSCLIKAI